MKKLGIVFVTMLMCLAILTGCATLLPFGPDEGEGEGGGKTPVEEVAEKVLKIVEASTIEQEIEIGNGSVTQFEQTKKFEKEGSVYKMEGHEKKLNKVTAEKAYAERDLSGEVKADASKIKLKLQEVYFSQVKVEEGKLEGQVKEGSVEALFGLTESLKTPVHGLTLSISTDATHVTALEVSYMASESTVKISMQFGYKG